MPERHSFPHPSPDIAKPRLESLESLNLSAQFYREQVDNCSQGPQVEGFSIEEAAEIVANQASGTCFKKVELNGQTLLLPFLVPANQVDIFDKQYLLNRYGPDMPTFYLTPSLLREPLAQEEMAAFYDSVSSGAVVLFEHLDTDLESPQLFKELCESTGLQLNEDELIDPQNNSLAAIIHYAGLAVPAGRPYQAQSEGPRPTLRHLFDNKTGNLNIVDGVTFIEPTDFMADQELQDHVWALCDEQFKLLAENLPVRQSPTRDELIRLISDSSTSTIVYNEGGKPITICIFLHDLTECTWLRQSYFEEKYGGEWMGYYALLATDKSKMGQGAAAHVINEMIELVSETGDNFRIAFECTNISADWIPYAVVEPVINTSGKLDITIEETARYSYRSFRVRA